MTEKNERPVVVHGTNILPEIVRPTMGETLPHCPELADVRDLPGLLRNKTYNAAHTASGNKFPYLVGWFSLRFIVGSRENLGQKSHED